MKKKLIIVAILIMSVGFALISTNLIINGTSTIGKTTFDVYFSGAVVDGYDKTNEVVKDKKNIVFTSKNLLFTDDTSELVYEVTNNSSNYDAKVNVSCTNPSNKITVEEVPKSLTVYARTIETGRVVVTLNEMAVDEEDVIITCTLNVNAEERTSLATDEIVVGTYGITGTLVDNNNNPISDQYLAIYSETKKIVQTDSNGFFYVSGLERGIHEIYLINESDIDSSDTEIKKKPKGITSTNKNGEMIILSNNFKIKDVEINTNIKNYYKITFNPNGGSVDKETKYIKEEESYGELPTPIKANYIFAGWFKDDDLTQIVKSDKNYTEKSDQTLYAAWGKSAVTELLGKKNPISITDYNSTLANKSEMFTFNHEATVQAGTLTDYRYIGNTPNNYIDFNGETWRIIGIFNLDGEQKIKIIRDESIERKAWDTGRINEWVTSSLKRYLNGDYFESLSTKSQNEISESTFYLGGTDGGSLSGEDSYKRERSNDTCVTAGYCPGETREVQTKNKVALAYPSDRTYTYAYNVDNNSRKQCFANGYYCMTSEYKDNSWFYSTTGWFITPSTNGNAVTIANANVHSISYGGCYVESYVHPVVYLKSDILITSGTGAVDNRYIIKNPC